MTKPLPIALIGCGRVVERVYVPALSHLKAEAQLVAVADPLQERRDLIASIFPGCRTFPSAEVLFKEAKIAAAIITTPPETHLAMSTLALQADMSVLVEKPLAPSMAGVAELEALAATAPGLVMVGFNRRYWGPIDQLRKVLKTCCCASAKLVMMTDLQAWAAISATSDVLDDLGSHQLDLLRYIFGREILAVKANWVNKDTIQMQVHLEDDIVADCLAAHTKTSREVIEVRCQDQQYLAHMQWGSERIQPVAGPIRSAFDFFDALRRRLQGGRTSYRRSHEQQLLNFFNSVRTGTTPQPGIADGVAVIRAVEAARQSATREGEEILIR